MLDVGVHVGDDRGSHPPLATCVATNDSALKFVLAQLPYSQQTTPPIVNLKEAMPCPAFARMIACYQL